MKNDKDKSTPQNEEQLSTDDELKKLRKREQRVLERLQEAQKAQAKALERFQRAEARLQKRSARLQRVEGRLVLLRQQLQSPTGQQNTTESNEAHTSSQTQSDTSSSSEGTGLAPAVKLAASAPAQEHVELVPAHISETILSSSTLETSAAPDEPPLEEDAEFAVNSARAAVEATEANVRQAAERASEIAAHSAPQELSTGAERSNHVAEVAAQPFEGAQTAQETGPLAVPAQIAVIEEEEEVVSAFTADTIAHITAERAAKAEVIAEISSKQTLEARRLAQEAEQTLAEVRSSIRYGTLSGEEAQEALWRAEHAVTRAQAFLADAEANEEQAVQAAMNAEADAEVAEGMAFASADHVALLAVAGELPAQEGAVENNDEADITTKISVMRPPDEA